MKHYGFYRIFSFTGLILLSLCACNSVNKKQQKKRAAEYYLYHG